MIMLRRLPITGWRRGVVVSGVRRMNKVNPRRARLGDRLRAGIPSCSKLTRSTQPSIPPGSLNRVPASAAVKAGMSAVSGGSQLTLCDPVWHVSSRCVRRRLDCELLYPYTLLYLLHGVHA